MEINVHHPPILVNINKFYDKLKPALSFQSLSFWFMSVWYIYFLHVHTKSTGFRIFTARLTRSLHHKTPKMNKIFRMNKSHLTLFKREPGIQIDKHGFMIRIWNEHVLIFCSCNIKPELLIPQLMSAQLHGKGAWINKGRVVGSSPAMTMAFYVGKLAISFEWRYLPGTMVT